MFQVPGIAKWQQIQDEKTMWYTMNEGHEAWGAMKSVLFNRALGRKTNCLYEEVSVPKALYEAKAWGIRNAKRRKENVLEMKFLSCLVGVSQMDRVRNEEVRRRAGIGRELASTVDQRILRWLLHWE